jgi:P4 family phage/plasmid primase-like protien
MILTSPEAPTATADSQLVRFAEWAESEAVEGAAELVKELQPAPLPNTPAAWCAAKFPALPAIHGTAMQESHPTDEEKAKPFVKDISEDFLAATLGEQGLPEMPTVFAAEEDRFYTYSPGDGIFCEERESKLQARLSELLLQCARACEETFDTQSLEFKFRDSANLRGVLSRARGLLEVKQGFFETELVKFVPCNNGMLRVAGRVLLPFAPSYRRRNKLAVAYDPAATCPLFLDTLLRPALEPDALDLLQRWCGLALIGVNLAQRLVILTGTAGGGKGTLIRVINGIIGPTNVGTLRPDLLGERFELGRLLGKSLLYGADVPDNFLNCKGASVLKSLTGGDPLTLEFKGTNERPEIICRFNAIVTCNSRLTVRLEGDAEAWRRRLAIIEYQKPKPETIIADLSERILATEGSGVLNWMLDGLDKIQADGWLLRLAPAQQKVVDDLLLESDADTVFAKECLRKEGTESLTVAQCYEAYVNFCNERGWTTMAKKKFSNVIGDTVTRLFGLTVRHDVCEPGGKPQRGWKGLECV